MPTFPSLLMALILMRLVTNGQKVSMIYQPRSSHANQTDRGGNSTVLLCTVAVVIDSSFYKHVANSTPSTAFELIKGWMTQVDKFFRATDFDGDNRPDSIGFQIAKVALYQEDSSLGPGESWTHSQMLEEIARNDYMFRDTCVGLHVIHHALANGELQPKTTVTSPDRGLCSGRHWEPVENSDSHLSDIGSSVFNAVPVNFRGGQGARAIAHQLGHLFGAMDDEDYETGGFACDKQGPGVGTKYVMQESALTKSDSDMVWSDCSLMAMREFLRFKNKTRVTCLQKCSGARCGVVIDESSNNGTQVAAPKPKAADQSEANPVESVKRQVKPVTNTSETAADSAVPVTGPNKTATDIFEPVTSPAETAVKPVDPVTGTGETVTGQDDPVTNPAKAVSDPIKKVKGPAKPVTSQPEPVTGPAEPVTNPAKAASDPIKTVKGPAKPVTSQPEPVTGPAEPVTTPAEPVTGLAETVPGEPEPVTSPPKTLNRRVEPVTGPKKPVPVKPVTSPAETAAVPVKPATTAAGKVTEPLKKYTKNIPRKESTPETGSDAGDDRSLGLDRDVNLDLDDERWWHFEDRSLSRGRDSELEGKDSDQDEEIWELSKKMPEDKDEVLNWLRGGYDDWDWEWTSMALAFLDEMKREELPPLPGQAEHPTKMTPELTEQPEGRINI